MSVRRVLLTGDHQCGSSFGLFPPFFKDGYSLNVLQAYLWQCWEHHIAALPPLDVVVFLGECIEGTNPKGAADAICETNLSRQVGAFVAAVEPILKRMRRRGSVYVMRSSQYHSGPAGLADTDLGERLDLLARQGGWTFTRDLLQRACHSWLHFALDGVMFDCAHHRSGAQVNRSMPLEREGRYNAMIADLFDGGPADVIARAHTHVDMVVSEGYRWYIGTPPWKFEDDFVMRGTVPNRTVTRHVGSILVEVDGERKRKGGDPVVAIRKLYYRHPAIRRYSAGAADAGHARPGRVASGAGGGERGGSDHGGAGSADAPEPIQRDQPAATAEGGG